MTNFFPKQGTIVTNSRRIVISIFIVFTLLSSCTTPKVSGYFKNITRDTIINTSQVNEELKIKKDDIMSIFISSLNKEEDELYNLKIASQNTLAPVGYPVDAAGEIYLHNIGRVKAEGLTRKELKLSLEQKLLPFLKDPVATVNFENHHVTVIGEITRPQVMQMPEEKISIIDLLAQSGTLALNAEVSNVLVIRQKDNNKEFKRLNLEDNSIFNSSFYYLQPNDVVVLNVDEKKVQREIKRQSYQQVSSLVLQALTMVLIVYQTFFRK